MSFIVKGIDLPKGTDGLSITFHSQDGAMETHILDATQAIQIPKGHGRIGDLDELAKHMKRNNPQTSKIKWMSIVTEGAPTILEVEE